MVITYKINEEYKPRVFESSIIVNTKGLVFDAGIDAAAVGLHAWPAKTSLYT